MADEEWVSDTETVDGDTFNKTDFNAVEAKNPDEVEAPVNRNNNPQADYIPGYGMFSAQKGHGPTPVPQQQQAYETAAPQVYQPPPVIHEVVGMARPPPPEPKQEIRAVSLVQPVHFPKPVPTVSPEELERQNKEEEREYEQARQLNQHGKGSKTSAGGAAGGRFQGINDQEIIDFFNEMNRKTFTEQAVEYLNAYWDEVGDQAEFIFTVAHKIFTEADMHRQGITIFYKYDEGSDVDYPTYLYFYEKLCKFVREHPEWRQGQFEKSAVYEVKTAIKHKKELQEKVDVNFDGRISFLEYLLYQYNVFSNPAQFMRRARQAGDEHPAILAARLALEEVNARIKAYEQERMRLEEGAKLPGVQGLTFKHQLAVLDSSPLAEELNKALITAEAAVRIAVRKFQGQMGAATGGAEGFTPRGALWWMQRDLEEKKKYGRKG